MPLAFLGLIACQLAGELLREGLHLPIPGPVIGMFLLAAILSWRSAKNKAPRTPGNLEKLAEGLIAYLGLLFVPAGVGIITEAGLLRQEWLPILFGLIGSTILSVAVTGLVMHWIIKNQKAEPGADAPNLKP